MILIALAAGWAGLAGCSKPVGRLPGGAAARMPDACDGKLVTQADIAPIVGEAITSVKPVEGDAQSCRFTTATLTSVTVSLRPGLGRATVDTWLSGKMPLAVTPVAGIGDRAVWQPTLHEVIAEKHDLLCDVGVSGPPAASAAATPAHVGAVCAKVFAARS